MGVWSMPALPSAKPGHHPQGNNNLKYRGTTGINQWRWGLGELYKPSRSQRHASHKRGQRLYGKGCPQQPTAPAEGEASPWLPLPTGSKEKKAFSRSTTPSWKGHRQRTGPEAHHAGLLFLPGPRASLGALGVGTGQERGGRAGEEEAGAGSRQCPAVRPPL